MRYILGILGVIAVGALLLMGRPAETRQTVVVGGYQFEPFVGPYDGVSGEFVGLLNKTQNRFDFTFQEIPASQRYALMASGEIDMILFEQSIWGWQEQGAAVAVTPPILSGAEVLVGRAGEFEGDLLYEALETRRLALTRGYHYGFADFNADPAYLEAHFSVIFADHQRDTLTLLLEGKADIAVLNEAFLERAYMADPSLRAALTQAKRHDQDYSLPIMVRVGGPVSLSGINQMLADMRRTGQLANFFTFQGLGRFVLPGE